MQKTNINEANKNLISRFKSGDDKAKGEIVFENMNLIRSIALRFKDRGRELEDIIEVGKLGLLKALYGFDETLGYSFSTYAFPLITGEIKRYLRDDGLIKVSRNLKKNSVLVLRAKEDYIKKHGKEPKISDLCDICNLSGEDIIEALTSCSPVVSLEDKVGKGESDMTVADTVADIDRISEFTNSFALRQEVSSLPEFERRLIELRYYREFTQVNTAKILGVSQVTVSRCEKKILEKLRVQMM